MSEANTADLTPPANVAPAADTGTSLTGDQPQGEGTEGGAAATGEGDAGDKPAGQGADAGDGGKAAAPAEGGGPKEGEGEATQGAPEQYADFTLPEGWELPDVMREGIVTIAKAHNMNQEQAQALVDLGVQQGKAIQSQYAELASQSPVLLADHWAQEWSKQTAADSEIGGQHLVENMALSRKVFATFGSPELAQFLNTTGMAHHPELARFMVKVGKAVSEDTLVTPQGGQGQGADGGDAFGRAANKLYGGKK